MIDITKLSPLHRVILLHIERTTKESGKRYMRRVDVTTGLKEILDISNLNSFRVILTNSINSLYRRGLVARMRKSVGLTNAGKEVALDTISGLSVSYGKVDWKVIVKWYNGSKEKKE